MANEWTDDRAKVLDDLAALFDVDQPALAALLRDANKRIAALESALRHYAEPLVLGSGQRVEGVEWVARKALGLEVPDDSRA